MYNRRCDKLCRKYRLVFLVTPPDLICSTPSPVAYIPVACSPTFSPCQLSEPSRISILPSWERTLDALRPTALYPDKWPDTALDRKDTIECFIGLLIDIVDPLLCEERGILVNTVQTTISIPNGCFLCWAKLVFEMLEASRVKNKSSKRDNYNRFSNCLPRLITNHLVEGTHGGLCVCKSCLFECGLKLLHRLINICANSPELLRVAWMLRICTALIHNLVDFDQHGADTLLFEELSPMFEHCAVGEDPDNLQTGADSDYRPEGSLPCYTLVKDLEESICDLHSMQSELWMTVKLIKMLLELRRMDTHDRIGSPTPPSPGSDRSQISFLSDSVVDWKELARGLSPCNSTQRNAEAWIDKLEALE